MALIGSVDNQGALQGQINDANGYLTGVISNAYLLGGQVVGMRGLKGDKGDTGDTGATGVGISSIAKTSSSGLVDTYTITYTNGNTATFDVTNGKDGTDGHSPTITASKVGDTTTIYADGVSIGTVIDGADGTDGYSPTANVSKVGDTATITITDKNSTTTATITDGTDGTDGQDGQDGADGFSPIANVTKVGDTATITITDENGTTTATISDGQDGANDKVYQQYQAESGYSYWRPLLIGKSSSGTEGFTPSSVTDQSYAFKTLEVQPSTGSIRMGTASFYKGSYTSKLSPTTLTANRTITIPNKSGTMALTSDISEKLYIVKVGYDSDEDEYYLNGGSFTDICDAYDEGMALILIYVDEDDYAYEYVLSNYAPDDDFITFSSSFAPEVVDTFTINSDDSVDYLQTTARTSALINDSLFVRGNSAVWEGTCSTVASTSAKYVNCSSFTADDQDVGTIVFVTFDETNSASPSGLTLNVQNRGAKPIKCLKDGQVSDIDSPSSLSGTMPFFYDGTNWVTLYDTSGGGSVNDVEVNGTSVVTGGVAEVTVPTKISDLNNDSLFARGHIATFHGTCSTAAGTGTKAVTCADFKASDLVAGAMIIVTFSNANSAAVGDLQLNVNSTGAYPIKQNKAGTISNFDDKGYLKASTYPFIFNGSQWVTWYNTDTNTVGYNIRTNASSLPVSGQTGRYRLLFTSADGTKYVPPNTSNSTSATASKTVNQEKIDPFGRICYYATTTVLSADTRPSTSYLYQQYYTISLGYSFNTTNVALTMTAWKPVYLKCTPQTDGSAIIDSTTPFVQDLPTTADGKIYIFLGIAFNETNFELTLQHPIYCYKNGHIQQWTNADIPTKTSDLNNDSGFITSESVTDVEVNGTSVLNQGVAEVTVPTKTSDLNNDNGFLSYGDFYVYDVEAEYSNIASGGNLSVELGVIKSGGWYPLGVVGFNTNRATLVTDRAYITNVTEGSCTVVFHAKATAAANANTAHIYVLWAKV